jgi:hypothetical protein
MGTASTMASMAEALGMAHHDSVTRFESQSARVSEDVHSLVPILLAVLVRHICLVWVDRENLARQWSLHGACACRGPRGWVRYDGER